MIGNFIRIYKIGRELGLTTKEIKTLWFFNNPKHAVLSILKIMIIIIIITFSVIFLFFFTFKTVPIDTNTTYPAGTLYSTVKIKDFRFKNNKKWKYAKK